MQKKKRKFSVSSSSTSIAGRVFWELEASLSRVRFEAKDLASNCLVTLEQKPVPRKFSLFKNLQNLPSPDHVSTLIIFLPAFRTWSEN